MGARVGLLSNPGSRGNLAGALEAMERVALARGCVVTRGRDAAGLDAAVDRLLDQGVDLLIVNGGDGTAQRVFTRATRGDFDAPLIGLLAGGRTNASAIDAGSAGKPIQQLQSFLGWAAGETSGQTVTRSLIEVSAGGASLGRGLFVAGAGLSLAIAQCRAFRARYRGALSGTAGTIFWSARLALRSLVLGRDLPSAHAALAGPYGDLFAGSAAMLLATTLRRLPAGLYPFPQSASHGAIRMTLVTPACAHRWGVLMPLLRGRHHPALTSGNGYHFWQGDTFTLSSAEPLLLDGETITADAGSFRISADRQVRLLRTAAIGR
ncbi:MAG: diacylglycerol kinase family protein [Pseudomonadota bacterium]|nr:diacylglycerol kinase family protein [Pseudomonadota bacterium]